MDSARKDFQSDLDRLSNEALVRRVQEQGSRPARQLLLSRCWQWIIREVAHRQAALVASGLELGDLAQELVLVADDAINQYDLAQLDRPNPCHFRSFLLHALHARQRNVFRTERRARGPRDPEADLDSALVQVSERSWARDHHDGVPHGSTADPALLAETKDFWEDLEKRITELSLPFANVIWQEHKAGKSLHQIARELGIGKMKVKRIWQLIKTQLRDSPP